MVGEDHYQSTIVNAAIFILIPTIKNSYEQLYFPSCEQMMPVFLDNKHINACLRASQLQITLLAYSLWDFVGKKHRVFYFLNI